MKDLENDLRKALERREPPAGFAERVLAQLELAPTPKPGWREALISLVRVPSLRWATASVNRTAKAAGGDFAPSSVPPGPVAREDYGPDEAPF